VKEMPLMREQLPLLFDRLHATPVGPGWRSSASTSRWTWAASRQLVLKYLNANFEDLFGSLMSSLKLGGSVALADRRQRRADPGGAVLPADGLGQVRRPRAGTGAAAPAPGSTASPTRPTRCWASTCAASCW
jgi:hypothetical protein